MDDQRTAQEWIAAYAEVLGGEPPRDKEVEVLLDLAGVAAHSSERIAAPIACYLVGKLGIEPERALSLAREVG